MLEVPVATPLLVFVQPEAAVAAPRLWAAALVRMEAVPGGRAASLAVRLVFLLLQDAPLRWAQRALPPSEVQQAAPALVALAVEAQLRVALLRAQLIAC